MAASNGWTSLPAESSHNLDSGTVPNRAGLLSDSVVVPATRLFASTGGGTQRDSELMSSLNQLYTTAEATDIQRNAEQHHLSQYEAQGRAHAPFGTFEAYIHEPQVQFSVQGNVNETSLNSAANISRESACEFAMSMRQQEGRFTPAMHSGLHSTLPSRPIDPYELAAQQQFESANYDTTMSQISHQAQMQRLQRSAQDTFPTGNKTSGLNHFMGITNDHFSTRQNEIHQASRMMLQQAMLSESMQLPQSAQMQMSPHQSMLQEGTRQSTFYTPRHDDFRVPVNLPTPQFSHICSSLRMQPHESGLNDSLFARIDPRRNQQQQERLLQAISSSGGESNNDQDSLLRRMLQSQLAELSRLGMLDAANGTGAASSAANSSPSSRRKKGRNRHSQNAQSDVFDPNSSRNTAVALPGTSSIMSEVISTSTRKMKDDKDRPKRPLTAYNLYFKEERTKLLAERQHEGTEANEEKDNDGPHTSEGTKKKRRKVPHGKMGFEEMARTIAERWRNIDKERLAEFDRKAEESRKQYKEAMKEYNKREKVKKANNV